MIEQAMYGAQDGGGYRFLARSPGFLDAWLPAAERLCTRFGERPAGVACPGCVFAQPFEGRTVAVVQAADQGSDDAGRPGALGFRLLILPATLYDRLGGNPFSIADQFPPDWTARGARPILEWPAGSPPTRTVEEVQKVLNVPHSATLLGGVQALLEGGRLVFERTAPDTHVLRGLWALLPIDRRGSLWPATFAFSNALGFDVVVVPRAAEPDFGGYLTEEQASDYPEGAYELQLQAAVEAGDQQRMDALFAGRTQGRWLRIAFCLAALAILNTPFVLLWLASAPAAPPAPTPAAPTSAAGEKPTLPAVDACPPLDGPDRQRFAVRLQQFARELHIDAPQETTDEALTDAIEKIDQALTPPDPHRDPGRLRDLGPVQRQLRALLWKHGVADYDAPGLNPIEMVEKLQEKVGAPRQ